MRVSDIQLVQHKHFCRVEAKVEMRTFEGLQFSLWYQLPGELEKYIDISIGDCFAAALLLPAMVSGEELEIAANVSQKLLQSLPNIQDIYQSWDQSLSRIVIKSTPAKQSGTCTDDIPFYGFATFFSGGVDSFYSLLKHHSETGEIDPQGQITHLILVRGFDIPITEDYDNAFAECEASTEGVATEINKQVISITTNIRDFTDLFVDWGSSAHGACLASVGLLMQSMFKRIYIASSRSYADLVPWGSHPLLDPLWSVESLSFIHDGCEASRLNKIRFISKFDITLKSLRVCFQLNKRLSATQLNCGRCEKCLRTMIGLHVAGVLDRCAVFPRQIDLGLVSNLRVPARPVFLRELYQSLGTDESDHALKSAIATSFEKSNISANFYNEPISTKRPYSGYFLHLLNEQLKSVLPNSETIIFVDEEHFRIWLKTNHLLLPFIERDGNYWGPPADDAQAIEEIKTQRDKGASCIIFAWPSFWWLSHYTKMADYLRSEFNCILNTEQAIGYRL